MKTGRLLKFQRKDTSIHAYLYQDGALFKAAIYVLGRHTQAGSAPDQELAAASGQLVEEEVRAWVDTHFPR